MNWLRFFDAVGRGEKRATRMLGLWMAALAIGLAAALWITGGTP